MVRPESRGTGSASNSLTNDRMDKTTGKDALPDAIGTSLQKHFLLSVRGLNYRRALATGRALTRRYPLPMNRGTATVITSFVGCLFTVATACGNSDSSTPANNTAGTGGGNSAGGASLSGGADSIMSGAGESAAGSTTTMGGTVGGADATGTSSVIGSSAAGGASSGVGGSSSIVASGGTVGAGGALTGASSSAAGGALTGVGGSAAGGASKGGATASGGASASAGAAPLPPQLRFTSEYNAVVSGIWGSGPNDIYAVGSTGSLLHSVGDGKWTSQDPKTSYNLTGVWGTGPDNIYVSVESNFILHSTGDGTWKHQEYSGTNVLPSVLFDGRPIQLCDEGRPDEAIGKTA
jgi:hypothetical protein